MTTLAPVKTSPPSPSWLVRRQNRALGWLLPVVVLAVTGFLLWQREVVVNVMHTRATSCAHGPLGVDRAVCFAVDEQYEYTRVLWIYLLLVLLALPVLAGAFVGAQSLAGDLESGRHRMLWTQSVTPARWLAHRLAWPAAALTLSATAVSLVNLWCWHWSKPRLTLFSWADGPVFWTSGPVYPAAVLAAFLLGAALALLLRRVVPAVIATFVLSTVPALGAELLRPYLVPVHTLVKHGGYDMKGDVWMISDGRVVNGHWITYADCVNNPACDQTDLTFERFHTPGQLWPLQWAEAGVLLALAAALAWLAFWGLRRTTR